MRILHVASFVGNIGDNASHIGFRSILRNYFNHFEIEEIEIRKFYKNYQHRDKKAFDETFINYANSFDLLVIGGGGFLDYWVEGSSTGTTIDLDPALMHKINVPTLITSVGCNPHQIVPEGNIEKFRTFLDSALNNDQVKIAVRTDGSLNSLRNDIGEKYAEAIPEVLDSGFFYSVDQNYQDPSHLPPYIAVNITDDQIRMNNRTMGEIDINYYYSELARSLESLVKSTDLDIVFVPHILSDLKAISTLLDNLDNWLARHKISIASCKQYDIGAHAAFNIYKNSDLVIGTRYHANVCSLTMGSKSLGLAALDRVKYLYEYLNLNNNFVSLSKNFSTALVSQAHKIIDSDEIAAKQLNQIAQQKDVSKNIYDMLFQELGF
jgi:polysaccharide pyruvyl transferase WcaK-like protein